MSRASKLLLLLLERRGQIGDLVAFDDARARRRILAGRVRLEVEVRGAGGLPDAGEIRLAARRGAECRSPLRACARMRGDEQRGERTPAAAVQQ